MVEAARAISELTHFDPDAGDACVLWCSAIRHAVLTGELDVRIGMRHIESGRRDLWSKRLDAAESARPASFANNGWVVAALQAAWSAIATTPVPVDDPDAGVFRAHHLGLALDAAVRAGYDTDTVAAIAGGLLGAAYGASAVPGRWRYLLHGWPGITAHGLPTTLPDPLPADFPLVGFGTVIDQPKGAQGAFGTVYRVRREFDDRILAGKLFQKDPSAPYPEMADAALRHEVKALESLTHPNIVRVLGPIPVTTQGEWMIISEWIDGSTLDDFTDGPKAMSGNEIFKTGKQLLDALTYLEDIGVVHRDIKPANVMVDGSGSVKLIDFNLTRETGLKTIVAGTPAYMPPDFLAQSTEPTASSTVMGSRLSFSSWWSANIRTRLT